MFESEVRRVNPEALREPGLNRARLTSLRDQLAGPVRQASLVLMGVVGFVLLIACANVAHLLLSRVTERRQELVIRAALGASRARLVQQLITECTLLTLASAAAGMAVAYWASRLAASVQPTQLAAQAYTILDWHVLGFAVVVASATGLFFGVLPANLIGRMQPAAELARMQPNAHGSGARRLRSLLVAMQAAFTLILLSGAITLGRSFLKLTGAELGFRTGHIVTMNVSLSGTPREDDPARYYNEALDRLRAIPGVEAAGGTVYLPLTPDLGLMGAGFRPESAREEKTGLFFPATAGYFGAMGTTILRGRDFRTSDRNAAIVNEAFVRQFPGTRSLVGQTMKSSFRDHPLTIVGIVRNQSLSPGYSGSPVVYVPIGDGKPMPNLTFVARVRGNTEAYLPVCRDALQSVEPKVPVFNVKTLDQRLDEALARPRFYTTAVLFFAVFALLLAVIGIYGVANFLIVQRTHEIGVRLAVGASPERLRATLLRQSLLPLFAGAAAGAVGAVAAGRVAESLISSAEPIGAPACAFAAALLAAVAAIAVWTATKRIVRLDPMRVLRAD
jgi:predicted permease